MTLIFTLITGALAGFAGKSILKVIVPTWLAVLIGALGGFVFIFILIGIGIGSYGGIIEGFVGGGISLFIFKTLKKNTLQKENVYHEKRESNSKQTPIEKSNTEKEFRVLKIRETGTTYESDGNEIRMIDNSKGNGTVRRKLMVSREWKKTISYSETESTRAGIRGEISAYFATLKLSLDKTLESKYNISKEETRLFSEEIDIEIMPHSKIVLKIDWKRIWQNGIIEVSNRSGEVEELPYKVSKGVTFDQSQEKVD